MTKVPASTRAGRARRDPRRLLVAGDVHGNLDWMIELVEIARGERCQAIVQLGDLGFFPRWATGRRFLAETERLLRRARLNLYFLEGNHDDLDALWRRKLPLVDGFAQVGEHLFYLPRGHRFRWRGVRFLAVGGAHSIDRAWRLRVQLQPRTLWWPEETLSDDDVAHASEGGEVDVLLAHDCPAGVTIPDLPPIAEAEQNRRQLSRIVDAVRPQLLLHGHYHRRFSRLYENADLGLRVQTVGLAHEHTGRGGWALLDVDAWASLSEIPGRPEESQ